MSRLRTAGIQSIAIALPDRVITNAELEAAHPDWQMSGVVARSGVEARRWCGADETALDIGVKASQRLLAQCDVDPNEIDSVLFCTQTPDYVMPPNACLLQARLGLRTSVAALDFTHACSGFIYGLYLAKSLVESSAARRVLLVTSETYSKWFNPNDRGPATLFGDGAAAALISHSSNGIGPVALGTDGSGAAIFCVPAGGARRPRSAASSVEVADPHGNRRTAENLLMDGAAVLAFVGREIPEFVRDFMVEHGETWDTLDLVVFHQGSRIALESLVGRLQIPKHKVFSNLKSVGNTVSASIPIALWDAHSSGHLLPGMRVLLVGFGVGMSWGACVLTWNGV